MNSLPSASPCRLFRLLPVFLVAACLPALADTTTASKNPAPTASTNASTTIATNAAPDKHGITITADVNDDDDDAASAHGSEKKHGDSFDFAGGALAGALIIPLVAILATFGTPVLIVFFFFYFRYRRRQETLATVREYLNKGLPVPPQLLEDSGKGSVAAADPKRRRCDLTRGFQLTFIGLGVTLALFVSNPHDTTWGWGLIPMIMGIGYLLSGWVLGGGPDPDDRLPPPGNPPAS